MDIYMCEIMKNIKLIIAAIFMLIIWPVSGQTAKEISKKTMDAIDIGNMEMMSTIHIRDGKGNDRVRQITTATRKFGDVSKTLIRFVAPADVKGTALLIHDHDNQADNMWIYMPALRKVRRIVSNEKGKNFMGSEFTNADMSKPNEADFTEKILGTVTLNGKECWKIESAAKDNKIAAENGFSKRISYIDKTEYIAYKIEYYDLRGNLHREQVISNYKKQANGKYFAFKMEMKNVQNGRVSDMVIDKFQGSSSLPESAFAPTALEN